MKHGTAGGYARGCRCDECRMAHREQARRYYDKANEWRRRKRLENLEIAREKDRERYRQKRRPQMLAQLRIRKYGVDPAAFAALLVRQGGRCAICRIDTPNGRGDWHIDHDHQTGRIRGLLCHACNVGLGHFGDNAERLRSALRYLEEPHMSEPEPENVTLQIDNSVLGQKSKIVPPEVPEEEK